MGIRDKAATATEEVRAEADPAIVVVSDVASFLRYTG